MRSAVTLGVSALVLLAGCYESRTRVGGGPGEDGGMSSADGAIPIVDAGAIDAAVIDRDAPPECVPDVIEPYAGPRCMRATASCLRRCMGDACDECFGADPNCFVCVNDTYLGCANELGCQEFWDEFACCAQRAGCGGSGIELFPCAEACGAEVNAFGECASPAINMTEECDAQVERRCFPPLG